MVPDGFIAKRTLELSGDPIREVTVLIRQPRPDGDDYRCEYQIIGLSDGKTHSSYGMGLDSMQALILTLQLIGAALYTSQPSKEGRLTWIGARNLGFPIPDVIADLVPNE
ncbi:MAG: hypothetical protein K8S25_16730 [Alphaproteobacteria bacterium]|nr:hypothetical protein [Alphaproteobacteria bacterium]